MYIVCVHVTCMPAYMLMYMCHVYRHVHVRMCTRTNIHAVDIHVHAQYINHNSYAHEHVLWLGCYHNRCMDGRMHTTQVHTTEA
jgi:hypothetical protein